jgi:epoxyqueuosine reductase
MHSNVHLKETLKSAAESNGFSSFGVAPAHPLPSHIRQRFHQWIADGGHAEMDYLTRNIEKRFNASLLVPGAQSVIILAKVYGNGAMALNNTSGIALYAWGNDYHQHMRQSGQPLIELLKAHNPEADHRFFTDTAPLSERSYAVMAGLGSIGKNGTLVTGNHGSMVWLSALVTTIKLPFDVPADSDVCGSCEKCILACPTGAIVTPGLIDANRCIAYHTNSSQKPIPEYMIDKLNGQIFGCDICQQVCPWNGAKKVSGTNNPLNSYPDQWPKQPRDWLSQNEQWFGERFSGSALERTGFIRIHHQSNLVCHSKDSSSAQPDDGK